MGVFFARQRRRGAAHQGKVKGPVGEGKALPFRVSRAQKAGSPAVWQSGCCALPGIRESLAKHQLLCASGKVSPPACRLTISTFLLWLQRYEPYPELLPLPKFLREWPPDNVGIRPPRLFPRML